MIKGKHIIIGITGSIAAYKIAFLVRLLIKEGAEVRIVMTELAKQFITPLTMATLAKNPVMVEFYNPENGDWNSHVDMGIWADLYLIAPATANTIGKMANGIADNLLLTTYLSAKCPVMVAPAMDLDMYLHPSTQKNIDTIRNYGNIIVEPNEGELASGLVGKGRMSEPEEILEKIKDFFTPKDMVGKNVLITVGPTHERIDPVRFIGNDSSGKMGFSLAKECAMRGAIVSVVCGPTNFNLTHPNITRINVISAQNMYDSTITLADKQDIIILCAAVADFCPENTSTEKIKRGNHKLILELKPTIDIAATLGKSKKESQILAGFALESNDEEENAISKLKRKNLDFIVLNSLNDSNACFGYNTNKITIINKKEEKIHFELKSKSEVAKDIINQIMI